MNNKLYMWHLSPNGLEQLCGFMRWQAVRCIADFNEAHRVRLDLLKSPPNPTGNGSESPRSIFAARLRSVQANV